VKRVPTFVATSWLGMRLRMVSIKSEPEQCIVAFQQVDVHTWDYPEAAFDVVVEIFTQFSSPVERALKWAGMRRALKPGGLLIIQGYMPKQLEYGTGGPKQAENLYTRSMLEDDFRVYRDLNIVEEEREIYEGTSHSGMCAVINFTARKP
jgi:hypothetical protein